MKKLISLALFLAVVTAPLYAADYKVDKAASKIAFSGTHADAPFKGEFAVWDATIKFDPNDLAGSKINVTIDTKSGKTGNPMYDGTLPTDDWFDVEKYPKAQYTSQSITKNADGSYTSKGMLTIKDKSLETNFTFALEPADLKTPPIKTSFSLMIDRFNFGMGMKSDDKAEWVNREIKVDVNLSASPQ